MGNRKNDSNMDFMVQLFGNSGTYTVKARTSKGNLHDLPLPSTYLPPRKTVTYSDRARQDELSLLSHFSVLSRCSDQREIVEK